MDWHEHPELYAAAFAEEIRRKADYIKAAKTVCRRLLEPAFETGPILADNAGKT
jgi:hypothetical protein